MVLLHQRVQNRTRKAAFIRAGLPSHAHNRPLADAQALVRNQQILVKLHLIAQSIAVRAGAERIIERKASGFHLVHADSTVRAGKILTEIHGFLVRNIHSHQTSCQLHHRLNGICQTLLNARLHHQTIHHNLNIVLNILIQLNLLRKLVQASVNPDADVAALSGVLQHLHMLSLAPTDYRSQKLDFRPLRHGHNLIHHLINGLPVNLPAAPGAVGNTDSGVEKTHIIINLCHSSHCRSGIPVRGLLINGNSRGKSFYALHIRLLHLSQELPCIGRQRFHVAALSLRINRVKSQGRLSRAGKSCQNYQLISRDIYRYIFQIVLIRSSYFNVLLRHTVLLADLCSIFVVSYYTTFTKLDKTSLSVWV